MINVQFFIFLCTIFLAFGLGYIFYKHNETQTNLQILTQKYTNLEIAMYKPPPSTEDLLTLYDKDNIDFLSDEDED